MRWLASALLLAPALALGQASAPLQPLAFVAGHCWKGTMPDGQSTDEHCFEWMYGGKFLRDRHVVKSPSKPDYVGETFYFFDHDAKQIHFIYLENAGGISRGTAEPAPDGMVFPPARYVAEKMAMTYRVRWTKLDADAYEAHSEVQGKDGWVTMFRTKLTKQLK